MKMLALLALFAVGCTTHIAPYKRKQRRFDPGEFGQRSQPQNGSLYAEGAAGLFEDAVAGRIGDIVTAADFEIDLRATELAAVSPQLLAGATVTRAIAAGAAVSTQDVTLPAPLARGTPIKIEMSRGAVRVRGTGLLERAARPGEPAIARLSHTRSIVRGTLRAPATLVVEDSP